MRLCAECASFAVLRLPLVRVPSHRVQFLAPVRHVYLWEPGSPVSLTNMHTLFGATFSALYCSPCLVITCKRLCWCW